MTTTTIEDTKGTAATWIAGVGAFLLVAAAAVFVAVRWDQLSEAGKLGIVVSATGAALGGGQALQRRLPATGSVVFHLGAFLLPVDVAALALHAGADWRLLTLVEGMSVMVGFRILAVLTHSPVLRWTAVAGGVVTAAGVAAVTPVGGPLVLSVMAAGALIGRESMAARTWAVAAGLAPAGGAVAYAFVSLSPRVRGTGTLIELGLAGVPAARWAAAAGAVAGGVLAVGAHRHRDIALATAAVAVVLTNVVVTLANASLPNTALVLAGPALFLLIELGATMAERDDLWRRVGRGGALAAEIVAGWIALPVVLAATVALPVLEGGWLFRGDLTPWGAAALLLAGGWVAAGARRSGDHDTFAGAAAQWFARSWFSIPAWTCGVVAAALITRSTIAGAVTAVAAVAAICAGRRVETATVALIAAPWAPLLVAFTHPTAAVLFGGAAALAGGLAVNGLPRGDRRSFALAPLAAVPAAVGAGITAGAGIAAGWLVAALVVWASSVAADGRSRHLGGDVLRHSTAAIALMGAVLDPLPSLATALVVTVLSVVDAWRWRDGCLGLAAAVAVQVVVMEAALLGGFELAEAGLITVASSIAWTGLAAVVDRGWQRPLGAAAAAAMVVGTLFTSSDPARFAEALLLSGVVVTSGGAVLGRVALRYSGLALIAVGGVLRIADAGVEASEPYTGMAAALLLIVGVHLRREVEGVSSWVAFGPAVALLGGSALVERIAGGPAWHSLVAGAVGVVAVAGGGWFHLAAPLLVGTALIVVTTFVEALPGLAGVPTWGWLAAGGSALLATGVALERTGASPTDMGRRLVDVVADRFE